MFVKCTVKYSDYNYSEIAAVDLVQFKTLKSPEKKMWPRRNGVEHPRCHFYINDYLRLASD